MKFVDEFRKSSDCKVLARSLENLTTKKITLMEVCGTHTISIVKYGIREILPPNIRLLSGPGCPVCVSTQGYVDAAIKLSYKKKVILATFGDMMRVPGRTSSLLKRKSQGGDIRIVYSPMDALILAQKNPFKEVVFLAIGFEATTPITALTALEGKEKNIKNLFFLTSHKSVPPILKTLLEDKESIVQGFLLPGHVSTIIGEKPYEFLCNSYKTPGVITGFEPVDILLGIKTLLTLLTNEDYKILNEYKRAVKCNGNPRALELINKTFKLVDSTWRGFGIVSKSGYEFNEAYENFDALKHFKVSDLKNEENTSCQCGEILKGKITPLQCPLFRKTCRGETPIGPCMVSKEGTCATYYKYYKEDLRFGK